MAVPEVSAGIGRQVVVSEAAADVDGDRSIRNAVIERGRVRISMEVNRVLLEQVGPHDHADVGKGQEELVIFVNRHQRRRDVAVHHADVHDLARIHVSIQAWRGAEATCDCIGIRSQSNGSVVVKRTRRQWKSLARYRARYRWRLRDRPAWVRALPC